MKLYEIRISQHCGGNYILCNQRRVVGYGTDLNGLVFQTDRTRAVTYPTKYKLGLSPKVEDSRNL